MYSVANFRFSQLPSLQILISGVLAVSLLLPVAFAETVKTGKLTALEGFVEQTPKFDTNLPDYHFQLGVKQTVLRGSDRKNLLHAKAKLATLRVKADQFYLNTTKNDLSLKAQTAKTAHQLQGQVDKNGQPLQGKVTEVSRSPLNTLERDVRAPFQIDLKKLMSTAAPNLVSAMDLQISEAPVRSAESIARHIAELEPPLNARAPHPDMPVIPPKVKVNANLTRVLDTQIKRSASTTRDATAYGGKKLQGELEQGEKMHGDGEKFAGLKVAFVPQLPSSIGENSKSNKSAIDQTAYEMDAQMAHVKKQTSSASDIDAELRDAKNQSRTKLTVSQPGMEAILTHARNLPQKNIPDLPNVAVQGDMSDVVAWDEWHARFASLARGPILKNVSGVKNPSGANTVQITVGSNHSLMVSLVKSGNPTFDTAILNAYKSLNGNSNLQFPKLSRRQSITFLVDNEHKGTGIPTGVQSQPSTGDKEIIRHHI
jgi:hypothetical protein